MVTWLQDVATTLPRSVVVSPQHPVANDEDSGLAAGHLVIMASRPLPKHSHLTVTPAPILFGDGTLIIFIFAIRRLSGAGNLRRSGLIHNS
jgi:hypothetical protein